MNRWAANNPELFEELGGNEGMAEYFRAGADRQRKQDREQSPARCVGCGRFIGETNMQDTLHCSDCWSDEDNFLY